jgi:hypothetical protein
MSLPRVYSRTDNPSVDGTLLCKFVGKRLPKHARNNVRVERVYIGPFGPLYDMRLGNKHTTEISKLPASYYVHEECPKLSESLKI